MTRSYSLRFLLCVVHWQQQRAVRSNYFYSGYHTRAVYNTWVPGCVDGQWLLNTQDPGVLALTSGQFFASWDNAFINGMDAFTNMVDLELFSILNTGGMVETLPLLFSRYRSMAI